MLDAQLLSSELFNGEYDIEAKRAEVPVFIRWEDVLKPTLTRHCPQSASTPIEPLDVLLPHSNESW